MRWEEIWDTALRIRNLFAQTLIPADLSEAIEPFIQSMFGHGAVAVRSSAPGEDSSKTSFAGLHESYVNIHGKEAILNHIRLVWASLWSDRALLYRQELGLDVENSTMAVIIQEMIDGERSGVVFGRSPIDDTQAVIEAVYGLNQGLVDGTVEPDRWILDRKTGEILSHHPAAREKVLKTAAAGVYLEMLPQGLENIPPLKSEEVLEVFRLALKAESYFGKPQDVEWTYKGGDLYLLQARPITTRMSSGDDQRPWYLSLTRSFENLNELRKKIEHEMIPAMEAEAAKWAEADPSRLSDVDLAGEIEHRSRSYDKWLEIYRRDCIPFAHGMRLFGQVYNDIMQPRDSFEFVSLLEGAAMVSTRRNRMLEDLAARIRADPELAACLKTNKVENCDPKFIEALDAFWDQYGDTSWGDSRLSRYSSQIAALLLEMASLSDKEKPAPLKDPQQLEAQFLSRFEEAERNHAEAMLDLARTSYRLRDDDNIYLGKIEGQVLAALEEGKRRISKRQDFDSGPLKADAVVAALKDGRILSQHPPLRQTKSQKAVFKIRARQIVGQPAGPGIAAGKARVIENPSDLFKFRNGEILVCDAIDPNMTFVVPLAAGIVERRGGMLIHGAIIAREYGLPCVTGAAEAAVLIKTGDYVTVDGYLGIVIIGEAALTKRHLGP
jgi:pyruvate,water dikinase